MFDFESYLMEALESFTNDPADTDYQRGYEAGLRDLYDAFMAFTPKAETIPGQLALRLVVDNEGVRD